MKEAYLDSLNIDKTISTVSYFLGGEKVEVEIENPEELLRALKDASLF